MSGSLSKLKFPCDSDSKCIHGQYPCQDDNGCFGNLECVSLKMTSSVDDYSLYSKWIKVRHTPVLFYEATDYLIGNSPYPY